MYEDEIEHIMEEMLCIEPSQNKEAEKTINLFSYLIETCLFKFTLRMARGVCAILNNYVENEAVCFKLLGMSSRIMSHIMSKLNDANIH